MEAPVPVAEDFASCLSFCRKVKVVLAGLFHSVPESLSFTADGKVVLILSSLSSARNSLYGVSVHGGDSTWQQLEAPEAVRQLSRSEQLLRERMRAGGSGITHYQYIPELESVLVNVGHCCRLLPCVEGNLQLVTPRKATSAKQQVEMLRHVAGRMQEVDEEVSSLPQGARTYESVGRMFLLRPAADIQSRLQQRRDEVQHKIASLETRQHLQQLCVEYPSLAGAVDYQLCPGDQSLLACIHASDIWLLQSSCNATTQLTNTADQRPARKVSAGQASFITQEEFDRYTGYWWHPLSGIEGTHTILYEEVDETDVELVHTFNPSQQSVEEYRYPRPGGLNAPSKLKLLHFRLEGGKPNVVHQQLVPAVQQWMDQWEYFPRLGWTPDGKSVWVQVLDRAQQHYKLVTIPVEAFQSEEESPQLEEEKHLSPQPCVLWEESSNTFLNMQKLSIVHFLPSSSDHPVRVVVVSQSSGYSHPVLLQGSIPQKSSTSCKEPIVASLCPHPLTSGQWVILGDKVWINDKDCLIYFEANKSSPLDRHLYAVRWMDPLPSTDPVQLTPSGYYHQCVVNPERNVFVATSSSHLSAPSVTVYKVTPSTLSVETLVCIWESVPLPPSYSPPTPFTVSASSGDLLHGQVFPPAGMEKGRQYPAVLNVYGGPEVQMVTNGFSRRLFRIEQWRQAGYAVVMLDNRGSANRGVVFEGSLKGRMGKLEVEDQVKGLEAAAETVGYLDLNRVAVIGWSYGGYMALMCLAQRPDVFKLAVAGAPVTDWMWYDTGYTERYLGVPSNTAMVHPSSSASSSTTPFLPPQAYACSSVLQLVPQFPNEPNRLLIAHGMTDENVLFTHTSSLLDALVSAGKPYQLQVFTGERHGIRSPTAANHCDASILSFLLKHL